MDSTSSLDDTLGYIDSPYDGGTHLLSQVFIRAFWPDAIPRQHILGPILFISHIAAVVSSRHLYLRAEHRQGFLAHSAFHCNG